jgi:hypothetical protein
VSEDGGAVPAPYVLDVSVVVAVARGDTEIMAFIQRLDGTGQAVVIPVLAITAASLDVRSDEADELLDGLELLGNAEIAPLKGGEQAARLAPVIAGTGLDPWEHTWPLSPTRPSVRSVFGGDMPSTPPCYRGPWLQQNSWRTCRVWVWSFEAQAEGGSSRRSPAAERDEPP